ncbi:MAG: hypothetical protein A2041_08990 [Bacteroidetes bacterium GWA2_31_9b]|nr:MAG: hypothetical protein A2041_08990 [Bacteroidetes bacterium GWA2_31_9b]
MKNIRTLSIIVLASIFLFSCDEDKPKSSNVVGEITVDLDANKTHVRAEESLIGNLVADAYKEYAESKGKTIDFAIINGGSIRYSESTRLDGIYPAGDFTDEMIEEIFPWTDEVHTVVTVTGSELKSIFERSVSSLPTEYKGWFLQVSKELKIQVNLSLQPQVLNETVNPIIIDTEGERIVSIKINNIEYSPESEYTLLTSDWISLGEDGYVTFANISSTLKENLDCGGCEMNEVALIQYIEKYTPVTPVIENRITFVQ